MALSRRKGGSYEKVSYDFVASSNDGFIYLLGERISKIKEKRGFKKEPRFYDGLKQVFHTVKNNKTTSVVDFETISVESSLSWGFFSNKSGEIECFQTKNEH